MSQPHSPLDRRRNAYRTDLADIRLKGKIGAARFVEGKLMQVRHDSATMRKEPNAALGLENEALFGEMVLVFDQTDRWAWCQLVRDNYVGYMPLAALSADVLPPTHRVKATGTFVYPEPNIKRAPTTLLNLNARMTVKGTTADNHFVELATGGFVYASHVCTIDMFARDFVDVAEQFNTTPYLWGGRTRLGLDCSGLVQLALEAADVPCPRDSDMAAAELGETVLVPSDLEGLRRGDLIYWPGHCGIMIDAVMLLHANGHHMSTVIEPLSQAARRIRKAGFGGTATGPQVSAIRRLPDYNSARP